MTTLAEPGAPAVWSEPGAWCTDPYDPRCNSRSFDYEGWKAQLNPILLTSSEGRRVLTELDPFLFAWVYLRKHLKDAFGQITFADPHFEWVRHARRWAVPNRTLRGERDAYVAPRSCGKSTFWFLLLPMWGAAHGHIRFAAAFADSGTQAELHLATFKRELSDNELLRRDYPDLCEPARRHNGKALALDTPLLTANRGWSTMGDVRVGDQVYHPDGHTVTVEQVHDVMTDHDCYRVTTEDGRSLVADGDHWWSVVDKRQRRQIRLMTTREMLAEGLHRDVRQRENRFVLPVQRALKTPDVSLPIDPYLLGQWLGDGHNTSPLFFADVDDVPFLVEQVRQAGYTPNARPDKPGRPDCRTWRVTAASPGPGMRLRSMHGKLQALGLLRNKHIPEQYLTAGTEQRLALLQGLLDSDGSIHRRYGRVDFSSSIRDLAEGVQFLARSLGWKAGLHTKPMHCCGKDHKPRHRVGFTPRRQDPFCPFRLPRKAALIRDAHVGRTTAMQTVSIASIELVSSVPVRCISVGSPDGLFLAGRDLIPTHNTINDSQQMLYTKSGFAFAARGIDSTSLGLKVDEVRPDLLIFDDVEPDESNYSEYQMKRRLSTIQDAVLPLNEFARVALVGTVTMPGSIVHQLVRWNMSLQRDEADVQVEDDGSAVNEHPPWITDERFRVHHYHAIVRTSDGGVRSVWEAKWPIEYLLSIQHTRSYKKNYANDPAGIEGGYWEETDFVYGDLDGVTSEIISVDPAVTTSRRADWTGIAVLGVVPPKVEVVPSGRKRRTQPQVVVYEAVEVRKTGRLLREHLLGIIARRPRVRAVLVETNQGGENWRDILHDLPVRLVTVHQTVKKEVRAANLLAHYQAHRVRHAKRLVRCEEQMLAFPHVVHDDLVDSVGAGAEQLLKAAGVGVRSGTVYQR